MTTAQVRFFLAALAAALVLALPSQPAQAGEREAMVTDAAQQGRQLRVVYAVEDLPADSDLDRSSVVVELDGRRVPVTSAAAETANQVSRSPKRTAMLVIDTSGSMGDAGIALARQASEAFLRSVPEDVRVGLVAFADQARVVQPPTRDREALAAAIHGLEARGNTTLYDGLTLAVRELGTSGERSVIVLSDGADTASKSTMADALAALRTPGVESRVVAFRTDAQASAQLASLTRQAGGRLIAATDGSELAGAFEKAAGAFDQRLVLEVTLPEGLGAGEHRLDVAATFGAMKTTASKTVAIAGAPSLSRQGTTTAPAVAGSTPLLAMIPVLLLVFVSVLALSLALLAPKQRSQNHGRYRELEQYALGRAPISAVTPEARQSSIAASVLQMSDRFVERRGMRQRIALQLDRANMRLRPHEWLVLRVCVVVASVAVFTLMLGSLLWGLLLGVVTGAAGTWAYLSIRIRRRLKAFEALLPDTLQLVASSLQTGFSLPQAINAAAEDGRAPVADELRRALTETHLGTPLEEALDHVAERMDSEDFRWTVMAIRIQREVGGNLAEVLRTTVATMRERAALRRHVKALSAEGLLSAYILLGLPVVLLLFLIAFRRPYVSALWTDALGLLLSGGALLAMLAGALWMRSIVRVEV